MANNQFGPGVQQQLMLALRFKGNAVAAAHA